MKHGEELKKCRRSIISKATKVVKNKMHCASKTHGSETVWKGGRKQIEHVYERVWNIFLIHQISQIRNGTSLNRCCPGRASPVDPTSTPGVSFSMPSSTCCGRAVIGGSSPTKGFRLVKGHPEPRRDVVRLQGALHQRGAPFSRRVVRVPHSRTDS